MEKPPKEALDAVRQKAVGAVQFVQKSSQEGNERFQKFMAKNRCAFHMSRIPTDLLQQFLAEEKPRFNSSQARAVNEPAPILQPTAKAAPNIGSRARTVLNRKEAEIRRAVRASRSPRRGAPIGMRRPQNSPRSTPLPQGRRASSRDASAEDKPRGSRARRGSSRRCEDSSGPDESLQDSRSPSRPASQRSNKAEAQNSGQHRSRSPRRSMSQPKRSSEQRHDELDDVQDQIADWMQQGHAIMKQLDKARRNRQY